MAPSPVCSRCKGDSESVCHAFMDCRLSLSMWTTQPHFPVIEDAPRSFFIDTFQWLLSYASSEELATIIPSLWACWICRNNIMMGQANCDVVQLSTSLIKMIRDYQLYNQQIGVLYPQRILTCQKWSLWIKVGLKSILMLTLGWRYEEVWVW